VGLGLLLGVALGFPFPAAALAIASDLPNSLIRAQNDLLAVPTGKLEIARDIAQTTFEDEFGSFNLFIIFFVTLGPLKVIPTFMQLTRQASPAFKRQLAWRSALIATLVISLVVIIGQNLLQVWQIQLPALMIAGGILLSLVALKLILAQYGAQAQLPPSPDPPELSLAVTPLAFPTILPPFGIAIALTLVVLSTELGLRPWIVMLLLLLVMGLNLLSMLAAGPILKFIRPVTLKILGFTLGVMQFALGIQFILVGLEVQALVIQILLRGQ
jgi:multiple antibiotic resistance protein